MTAPRPLTARTLRTFPLPAPLPATDKDGRGRVLAVAGSPGVPGAAILTGVAALRAGAGKVQLAVPRSLAIPTGLAFLECGVIALPDAGGRMPRSFAAALQEADAVLVGPGLQDADAARAVVLKSLRARRGAALVLDALALAKLWPHADAVRGSQHRLVLTPHCGEMATLLGITKAAVRKRPLDCAAQAAARLRAVVVLKDETTHIVTPDGKAWLYDGGGVGLATSGSGDILAGVLTALLARGADAVTAALWAVMAHGTAGRRLARRIAPTGFLARELLDEIPRLVGGA